MTWKSVLAQPATVYLGALALWLSWPETVLEISYLEMTGVVWCILTGWLTVLGWQHVGQKFRKP